VEKREVEFFKKFNETFSIEGKEAEEVLDGLAKMTREQGNALDFMGVITMMIAPHGLFKYTASPNLVHTVEGLSAVEAALLDLMRTVNIQKTKVLLGTEMPEKKPAKKSK